MSYYINNTMSMGSDPFAPLSRTDDYINVNGYDQATGAGACVDFEKKVDDAEQIETHLPGNGGISSKDWSAK